MVQCEERGLQPGPLNTYVGWQRMGRQVIKGEKALTLCMPLIGKRRPRDRDPPDTDNGDEPETYRYFGFKPNWFVLSQTDGPDQPEYIPPEWEKARAFERLQIREVPFAHLDGNALGYARGREIAISPLSPFPHKTRFHEIAHVDLGHTTEHELTDGEHTSRNIREVEAEGTALLCLETLGLEGSGYARGYLQRWLDADAIPEPSAKRIFRTADRILNAGYERDEAWKRFSESTAVDGEPRSA